MPKWNFEDDTMVPQVSRKEPEETQEARILRLTRNVADSRMKMYLNSISNLASQLDDMLEAHKKAERAAAYTLNNKICATVQDMCKQYPKLSEIRPMLEVLKEHQVPIENETSVEIDKLQDFIQALVANSNFWENSNITTPTVNCGTCQCAAELGTLYNDTRCVWAETKARECKNNNYLHWRKSTNEERKP